jgi:signal transduction histidine kinase
MFVSLEVISVILLDDQVSGKLQFLRLLNAVVGTAIAATFVYGAVDLAKRNLNYAKSVEDKEVMQTKYISTRELLFRIDNETREEVGAWLHGTLQPQLTRLAKEIRTKKDTNFDSIAQKVDEIGEKYVRAYSHDLYPPALAISLEVALETLLEGRAELVLDERLTNAADVGFAIWSPESGISDNNRTLRLHLGAEIVYATYRIIEEAVANAEKKPSTTRIIVDVRYDGEHVRISVTDNGDPISNNAKAGLGLSIIDAFMQKFDGTLTMNNVANGVEILVLLPYQAETIAEMLHKRFGRA